MFSQLPTRPTQLAQAVTGSKGMHIVYDQLFVKEPGTKNETPWHTDHSYWCVRVRPLVSPGFH
jgi:hypothetical protein